MIFIKTVNTFYLKSFTDQNYNYFYDGVSNL